MCAYGDIMDRLNDTRPVKDSKYNPFIPDGDHDLVVVSIEPYNNQEQHFCVRATFVTESSSNAQVQPGATFDAVWNLDKPAPFPSGERDKDRFAAFLNALQGVEPTPTSHHQLARAALKTQAEGGQLEVQPCRGARIKAHGRTNQPKPKRDGTMSKAFTAVGYRHATQQPQDVAAMRTMLDQRMPYTYRPQQVPQQQAPAAAPAWGAPPAAQPQYAAPAAAPAQQPAAPAAAPSTWAGFFPPKG